VEPDFERGFVDSSPSNGEITWEPYTKVWGDTTSNFYGDVHYYNYNADCENYSSYPESRFISEHGVQSFPSFQSYSDVSIQEDWDINSTFMQERMRHEFGNE